jgi:archaeosine-15-forming tRNA-guanine transglycosylase
VTNPCTVVIGPPDFLAGLKERAGAVNGEVLAFSNDEALRALEAITKRKPTVVAMDRLFAVTPRGAALIQRIKSDPTLRLSEIRVLEHNSDYTRVVPRPAPAAPAAPALDQRGTRRAPRVRIRERVTVLVDGTVATLVDLSTVGAQIVTSVGLKPNQRVDVAFGDTVEKMKCVATVIWTAFEMSGAGARFRAGLDFPKADGGLGAYAGRHKA